MCFGLLEVLVFVCYNLKFVCLALLRVLVVAKFRTFSLCQMGYKVTTKKGEPRCDVEHNPVRIM